MLRLWLISRAFPLGYLFVTPPKAQQPVMLKELAPDFLPKWVRLRLGGVAFVFVCFFVVLLGQKLPSPMIESIGIVGALLTPVVFIAVWVLRWIIKFIGVFWPLVAHKSAELEQWLDHDISWPK